LALNKIFTHHSYAKRVLADDEVSVRLSVCPSVCHTLALYQNGDTQNYEVFTSRVWFFWWQNFVQLREGLPLERRCQIWVAFQNA